jgi:hypothetical protein
MPLLMTFHENGRAMVVELTGDLEDRFLFVVPERPMCRRPYAPITIRFGFLAQRRQIHCPRLTLSRSCESMTRLTPTR